jgi:hypothetical protein
MPRIEDSIRAGMRGTCPECGEVIRFLPRRNGDITLAEHGGGKISLRVLYCPNCRGPILLVVSSHSTKPEEESAELVYPANSPRPLPSKSVPEEIRKLYSEARSVELRSERAAAALLRGCLEMVLKDRGFNGNTLAERIDLARKDSRVHKNLGEKLDIVREVGNFGLHATYEAAGDLLRVEPHEVDALFNALSELFNVFYVEPEKHAHDLRGINEKLRSAGRKPIA